MPLVRIDLESGTAPGFRQGVSDIVHRALVDAMNVPQDDRFQIISEHEPGDFVIDPAYLGINRSRACIIIQVTLNAGRTVDLKKAFYAAVASSLHAKLGVRTEDVFISLIEVTKENWSFGNGIAQYA